MNTFGMTVPPLAPQGNFAPLLAVYTTGIHLNPQKRGGENIERSVFNVEAVTVKKRDEEGESVVKDYVSTGRTYTTRS
jgi:hypothetical protein